MKARLLVVAVTLMGLTAFAPAPFPRRERGGQEAGVAVGQLQGVWTITKLETTQANAPPTSAGDYLKEVEIAESRWTFVYRAGQGTTAAYSIRIDHKASPAQLDFYQGNAARGKPYGTGIIRRRGDVVELLYSWGSPRPASFENPPSGYWLLTLQRGR